MIIIAYTGAPDAVCPITLQRLDELLFPVAFRSAPHQPYECKALVDWLLEREVNPLTNTAVDWAKSPLEAIGPLSCCKATGAVSAYIEKQLNPQRSLLFEVFRDYGWIYFAAVLYAFSAGLTSQMFHTCSVAYGLWHSIRVLKTAEAMIALWSGVWCLLLFFTINTFFADKYNIGKIQLMGVTGKDALLLFVSLEMVYVKFLAHFVDIHAKYIKKLLSA